MSDCILPKISNIVMKQLENKSRQTLIQIHVHVAFFKVLGTNNAGNQRRLTTTKGNQVSAFIIHNKLLRRKINQSIKADENKTTKFKILYLHFVLYTF